MSFGRRLLAAAGFALVLATVSSAARTYTVDQVRSYFQRRAHLQLVRVPSASTARFATLAPKKQAQFGRFQLYVIRPQALAPTLRAFLGRVRPDRRGIYWVRDQNGGWVAITRHGANILAGWFPPRGRKQVSPKWNALEKLLDRL